MRLNRPLWILAVIFILLGCSSSTEGPQFRESTDRGIIQVSPERPVRIELRKTTKGYTWTLRGEDIEKVIEADRQLRKYMDSNREVSR